MKRITGAALVTLMGAGLLAGGATTASATECVPVTAQPGQDAVYETVVVTVAKPAIPAKPAVYETVVIKPAVAEVSHTEYKFIQKETRNVKWNENPNWNPGIGWYKGQETRTVIDVEAQAEVTEQRLVSEAVAEVPAVAEVTEQRLVREAVPAVEGVECPDPDEGEVYFAPVTIDWLLAPGSTVDAPFAGGDQPRYIGTPDCGGVIQRDTYYPENQAETDLVNSLGDSLTKGEDFGVVVNGKKVWLTKEYVFYSLPDCETPVTPPAPPMPETPVTPPMTTVSTPPQTQIPLMPTTAAATPQIVPTTLAQTGIDPWLLTAVAGLLAGGGVFLKRKTSRTLAKVTG